MALAFFSGMPSLRDTALATALNDLWLDVIIDIVLEY